MRIAGIAEIARNRRNRKSISMLPLILMVLNQRLNEIRRMPILPASNSLQVKLLLPQ